MPKTFKFLKWHGKKAVALLVLTVVLAVGMVGGTVAFIVTQTDALTNVFEPANVNSIVNGNVITNDSETAVYVRAAIILSWVADDGSALITAPAAGEYTLTVNENDGWFKASDGFWYYKYEVAAGENAPALISGDVTVTNAPDGYKLSVEVLSSVIQSNPATAITSSWQAVDVWVENGQTVLVAKTN